MSFQTNAIPRKLETFDSYPFLPDKIATQKSQPSFITFIPQHAFSLSIACLIHSRCGHVVRDFESEAKTS